MLWDSTREYLNVTELTYNDGRIVTGPDAMTIGRATPASQIKSFKASLDLDELRVLYRVLTVEKGVMGNAANIPSIEKWFRDQGVELTAESFPMSKDPLFATQSHTMSAMKGSALQCVSEMETCVMTPARMAQAKAVFEGITRKDGKIPQIPPPPDKGITPVAVPTAPAKHSAQALSAADEAAVTRFKELSGRLGSSDGTVLKVVGEEMRKLGAQYVDGQFVLIRGSNVWATGPIRSTIVTRYVTGQIASVTYPTRLGYITLERAENISGGIAGWKLNIPAFNLQGKTIMGIPANQAISEGLVKGLTLIWAGWEAKNIVDYFNQKDHLDVGPTPPRLLKPPSSASALIWVGLPENNTWVETSWVITLDQLRSGWNGVDPQKKVVLPLNEERPVFFFNGLAGMTIPKTSWPTFGPQGNRVASDWTYKRIATGYELRLNGQTIAFGTSGDYVALHISDFGMWLVPLHYQHGTTTCAGLCVQQSMGGEEFLFQQGAEPKSVDLCPRTDACWK
jgi:hypothetical protein